MEPIYNALLAQFIRKHGHKPGDQPTKHPVGDALFRAGQLRESVGPLILAYINMGQPVEMASHLALESAIRSALEMGFATGRVFQSHGFNVPASV